MNGFVRVLTLGFADDCEYDPCSDLELLEEELQRMREIGESCGDEDAA